MTGNLRKCRDDCCPQWSAVKRNPAGLTCSLLLCCRYIWSVTNCKSHQSQQYIICVATPPVYTRSMFPLFSVTSTEHRDQTRTEAALEMGHPVTSCVVVEWGLRGGHVMRASEGRRAVFCVCVCVRVFTCPVRWSWWCMCEWGYVLECGLTFNSDTTSNIRSPQTQFIKFSRVGAKTLEMLFFHQYFYHPSSYPKVHHTNYVPIPFKLLLVLRWLCR